MHIYTKKLWIFVIAYMHTRTRGRVGGGGGLKVEFLHLGGNGIIGLSYIFVEGWREGEKGR
jgi:hypothetical protein